jgi:acyl-coenzyme A synthetase/AMP-(fatty) acid ligase
MSNLSRIFFVAFALAACRLLAARGRASGRNEILLGTVQDLSGLNLGVAAGAPVSADLMRWYRAHGVDLRQGSGLAETGGYVGASGLPYVTDLRDEVIRTAAIKLRRWHVPERDGAAIDSMYAA